MSDRQPHLVFNLPLPPREAARNSHVNHHAKGRAIKQYIAQVQALGKIVMQAGGYVPKGENQQYRGQITVNGRKHIVNKVRTIYPAPYFEKATYNITVGVAPVKGDGRYRPKDDGNAVDASKQAIDGLVRIGLLKDDTSEYLRLGSVKIDKSFTGLTLEFIATS